jgi:hypothetical protein
MSSAPPTQQHVPPQPPPAPRREGVDFPTLVITAVASAVAAYVCSKVWAPGTLASAAFTPVLVALVKEALRRPTEVVTTAVPPVLPGRQRRGQAAAGPAPGAARAAAHDEAQPGADLPQPAIVALNPPPITYHRTTSRRGHWRIALITGLLGFALCAAVYTVPELLSKGQGTTLFGGGGTKHVTRTVRTQSTTVIEPGKTVTKTAPTTTTTPATTPTQPSTETETTQTAPTVTNTVTTTAPTATTTPPTTGTETAPSETLPVNPVP